MRVVDEETLRAADLETEAPRDEEAKVSEDVEGEKSPVPPPPPSPEPDIIGPEEEPPPKPKPKRKPRKDAFKGEILVPALEKKRDAFVEPSKLRKDRLKEKIECPNGCGKLITRHAASYTHNKTCAALKRKESDVQTDEEPATIVVKEPDFDRKEAEKRLRKPPEVPPNVEFVERLKQAAWAYRQLEEQKHSTLIRQYFGR